MKYTCTLVEGRQYHLTFTAKADHSRSMGVCAESGGLDLPVTMGLRASVEVPAEWKTFDYYFKASHVDGKPDKVPAVIMGGSVGTIWFKEIVLQEVNTPGF